MKHIQKAKGFLATAALVGLLSLSFFLGGMAAEHKSESSAVALAKEKLETRSDKDIVSESENFLDNSREFAKNLLQNCGEAPLLGGDGWGNSSLETILNDVNAGNCAREAILAICEKEGLDAKSAKISNLTEEQIMEMDQESFRSSNHPLTE